MSSTLSGAGSSPDAASTSALAGIPQDSDVPAAGVGWVLTLGGFLGGVAALALLIDRIRLLENPAFVPSCSIDSVLTCTSIMTSPQAEVFGFPNPIIGVLTFPVVATLGVLTVAGTRLPGWVWTGLQLGVTAGVVFVHWLIAQSLYVIGALCPYCMAVWAVTISIFWYTTLHTLALRRLGIRRAGIRRVVAAARSYHSTVLAGWLMLIAVLVVTRFWPYWTGGSA